MRTTRGWTTAVLLSGLAAASVTGCASPPAAVPPVAVPPEIRGELEHNGEELSTRPIELETMDWLNELDRELHGDPSLGAVAIDDARSTVTITWHGPHSVLLDSIIASAPDGLEVVVQEADFSPGELQKLVQAAMEPGAVPGVQLAMGYVRNDGSGLHFGIVALPLRLDEAAVAEHIGRVLGRPDVPISVEVSGAVVPLAG